MHINGERCCDAGMAENLGKRLRIKPELDTAGCKCMAQLMEGVVVHAVFFEKFLIFHVVLMRLLVTVFAG